MNIHIPENHSVRQIRELRVCRTEKFKAGTLSVSAALPIQRDSAWKTSLLLSVLRRGTEKYPTLSHINRHLDYLYGTELSIRNFYRGDYQIIGFSAELLDSEYLPPKEDITDELLDMMCQILFHPQLDENGLLLARYVESEKQLQCDTVRAAKNNPRAYAADQARALLYENEPCGAPIYGEEAEIMAITPAELTAHWKELLSKLSLSCFYVGSADPTTLKLALERTLCRELNDIPLSESGIAPSTVIRTAETVKKRQEALDVGQSQLILGFRTGISMSDPAFYACVFYNELLGVSPISKLFVNVREKRSLCYSCSSSYQSHKGTLTVSAGISRKNRKDAEKEIFAQMQAIQEGKISDEEWAAAASSLQNAYRQIEDSPAALEGFFESRAMAGVADSIEDCRHKLAAVTKQDVIAVANGMTLDTVYFLDGLLDNGEEDEYDA